MENSATFGPLAVLVDNPQFRLRQISRYQSKSGPASSETFVKPGEFRLRAGPNHNADLCLTLEQTLDEEFSDETGTTCNDVAHRRSLLHGGDALAARPARPAP